MIDLGEFLVQFCSQVLGLFLLEEFRTFPDGSGGSGLPMDSVGFHTTPVGGETIAQISFSSLSQGRLL